MKICEEEKPSARPSAASRHFYLWVIHTGGKKEYHIYNIIHI